MSDQSTRAEGDDRQKSVLFCPSCGHESPVAGDWRVSDLCRGTAYECPDCDTTVTVRRRGAVPA